MKARKLIRLLFILSMILVRKGGEANAQQIEGGYSGLDVLLMMDDTDQARQHDRGDYSYLAANQILRRLSMLQEDLEAAGMGYTINAAGLAFDESSSPRLIAGGWQQIEDGKFKKLAPGSGAGQNSDLMSAFTDPNTGAFAYFDDLYDEKGIDDPSTRLQVIVLFLGSPLNNWELMDDITENIEREFPKEYVYAHLFYPRYVEDENNPYATRAWANFNHVEFYKTGEVVDIPVNARGAVKDWRDALVSRDMRDKSAFGLESSDNQFEIPPYTLRARFTVFSPEGRAGLTLIDPNGSEVNNSDPGVKTGDGGLGGRVMEVWELDAPMPGEWRVSNPSGEVMLDYIPISKAEWEVTSEVQQYREVRILLQLLDPEGQPIAPYPDGRYPLTTNLTIKTEENDVILPHHLQPSPRDRGYTATFVPTETGEYTVELDAEYEDLDLDFFTDETKISVVPTMLDLELDAAPPLVQGAEFAVTLYLRDEAGDPFDEKVDLAEGEVRMYPGAACSGSPLGNPVPFRKSGEGWQAYLTAPAVGGYNGRITLCADVTIGALENKAVEEHVTTSAIVETVTLLDMQLLSPELGEGMEEIQLWDRQTTPPWDQEPLIIRTQIIDAATGEPFIIDDKLIQDYLSRTDEQSLIVARVQRDTDEVPILVPLTRRANGVWSNEPTGGEGTNGETAGSDSKMNSLEDLPLGNYQIHIDIPDLSRDAPRLRFASDTPITFWVNRSLAPFVIVQWASIAAVVVIISILTTRTLALTWGVRRNPMKGKLTFLRKKEDGGWERVHKDIDLTPYKRNVIEFDLGDFPVVNPPISYLKVTSNWRLKRNGQIKIEYRIQNQSPTEHGTLASGETTRVWIDSAQREYFVSKDYGPAAEDFTLSEEEILNGSDEQRV